MPKYPKGVAVDVKGSEVKAMFSVTGMTCSACAGSVEKAIKRLPGILEAVVDVLNNRAQVLFYPSSLVNVSCSVCCLFSKKILAKIRHTCLVIFLRLHNSFSKSVKLLACCRGVNLYVLLLCIVSKKKTQPCFIFVLE